MQEHVMDFAMLIVGLGVADLLLSLHRLLQARERVEWDWLSPAFAAMALLVAFVNWWAADYWIRTFEVTSIAAFLPVFFFSAIAFLLMAGALPDEVPEGGIDLRRFYMKTRVRLWTLMLLLVLLNLVAEIVLNGPSVLLAQDWPVAVTGLAALAAILSAKVRVQAAALLWSFGFTLWANVVQPALG